LLFGFQKYCFEFDALTVSGIKVLTYKIMPVTIDIKIILTYMLFFVAFYPVKMSKELTGCFLVARVPG
jgi:hypothetical protein